MGARKKPKMNPAQRDDDLDSQLLKGKIFLFEIAGDPPHSAQRG